MADTAEAFARLMAAHRSICAYEDRPIAPELFDTVCEQALAGSASSGNLNMVSVVRTRDLERERRVYELYFEQPMVEQAPPVMTLCADTFRTVPDFSPHGTRGTAATLLREHGFSRDVVELMLAHAERNRVTAACHHHDMAEERRRALRYLADQIDRIAGDAVLVHAATGLYFRTGQQKTERVESGFTPHFDRWTLLHLPDRYVVGIVGGRSSGVDGGYFFLPRFLPLRASARSTASHSVFRTLMRA